MWHDSFIWDMTQSYVTETHSCHTYEWVTSHIWMIRVANMNESCHTCEWVMSQIWMSHVTHMNESFRKYELSYIWMRRVANMNESCHTYGVATISRLLKIIGLFCRISSLLYGSFAKKTLTFKEPTNRSHSIWISLVFHVIAFCLTYEWVTFHIWMSHVIHVNELCHSWLSDTQKCTYTNVHAHKCTHTHTHERKREIETERERES